MRVCALTLAHGWVYVRVCGVLQPWPLKPAPTPPPPPPPVQPPRIVLPSAPFPQPPFFCVLCLLSFASSTGKDSPGATSNGSFLFVLFLPRGGREETVVSRERGHRHRDVHAKVNAQLPARRYPTLTPSHHFLPSCSCRQGEKPRVGAWTPSGCCSSKGCSRHRAAYPRRSASAFQAECPLCLRSGGQVKGGRLRMSSACVCVCR